MDSDEDIVGQVVGQVDTPVGAGVEVVVADEDLPPPPPAPPAMANFEDENGEDDNRAMQDACSNLSKLTIIKQF